MPGENCKAVEDSLCGSIRPAQNKGDGVRAVFSCSNCFIPNGQEIALWRIRFLVEVDLEAKHNIIGIEGRAVGEADAVTKLQGIAQTIMRDRPRFGERRNNLLGIAID